MFLLQENNTFFGLFPGFCNIELEKKTGIKLHQRIYLLHHQKVLILRAKKKSKRYSKTWL